MSTLAAALVLVLYVLHQDNWLWREARPFVLGFIPVGLFYHALFTAACSVVMWLLVKCAWPGHLDSEPQGRGAPAPNE
jgi:hypothetical protein